MSSSKFTDKSADSDRDQTVERQKLIGLGKRSISKSYYPELKNRLEELEQFRTLLDRVNDAIFVVDADTGTILDTSGSTHILLDCDPDQIKGSQFKDILPQHIRRHADNLFNNETKTVNLEMEFNCSNRKDPLSIPVDLTLQLVTLGDKRRAIIVARDIRERKRNERALKQSHDLLELRVQERTKELAQANKAKSEFLSIVSHELRTPLTAVLGFTKIIRKKLVESILPALKHLEGKRLQKETAQILLNIDIIISEGNRLTSLIDNVLDLAKMEANKVVYTLTPLHPEEFIKRSVDAVSSLFDSNNLVLSLDVEPDLPQILGDIDRLIQVMVNLFSNSVKFTSEGSVICSARRVGDNVRVSVSDTGIGIPEGCLEYLFGGFTHIGEGASDRPRGTGLGLPICRHIIEEHGGHIWAENCIDKGSRFAFTLPVLKPSPQMPGRGTPPCPHVRLKAEQVSFGDGIVGSVLLHLPQGLFQLLDNRILVFKVRGTGQNCKGRLSGQDLLGQIDDGTGHAHDIEPVVGDIDITGKGINVTVQQPFQGIPIILVFHHLHAALAVSRIEFTAQIHVGNVADDLAGQVGIRCEGKTVPDLGEQHVIAEMYRNRVHKQGKLLSVRGFEQGGCAVALPLPDHFDESVPFSGLYAQFQTRPPGGFGQDFHINADRTTVDNHGIGRKIHIRKENQRSLGPDRDGRQDQYAQNGKNRRFH
eukprot:TRINITY_DN10216_c0_g3_i1.p1 TRINITY_DN10216_c0_g3~~TRINITY_DN10216_c0_g3_i1.p1  ORF type:complete len:706 (-),score=125.11 TRINITY_DN10216_c0_g3_i1:408-2525(-)